MKTKQNGKLLLGEKGVAAKHLLKETADIVWQYWRI